MDLQRAAVSRLEDAGCRAAWTNEVIGKDALVQLAVLLGATSRMVFGTCIANAWVRPAPTLGAAAAQLAQAHPGRFVLGLGVGHPEQAAAVGREFGAPLSTLRDYWQQLAAPTWPPVPDVRYPRIIAANGPKMLALAAELADGALPAGLPPDRTAAARELLGPDKLLIAAVPAVDGDSGDPTAALVREHLAVGADHVVVMLGPGGEFAAGVDRLERLVPVLR